MMWFWGCRWDPVPEAKSWAAREVHRRKQTKGPVTVRDEEGGGALKLLDPVKPEALD